MLILCALSGGAEFAASFGPGRYSVFTCVDFKGVNVEFTKPTEFGVWLGNFPIKFATNLQQVYFGKLCEGLCVYRITTHILVKASSPNLEPFSPSLQPFPTPKHNRPQVRRSLPVWAFLSSPRHKLVQMLRRKSQILTSMGRH